MNQLSFELENVVWLHLPVRDLLHLCRTNKSFAQLCQRNSTWQYLIQRDFGRVYNGDDAYDKYRSYMQLFNFFTDRYPIVTKKALDAILESVPLINLTAMNRTWETYGISGSVDILDYRTLDIMVSWSNALIKISKMAGENIELIKIVDPEIANIAKLVNTKGCDSLRSILARPTLVYINKKPRIVDYDYDLVYEIAPLLRMQCDRIFAEVIEYYKQLV